ncbi:hypothetical protein C2U70_18990, partial [Bradyrhizobium guangdongense]
MTDAGLKKLVRDFPKMRKPKPTVDSTAGPTSEEKPLKLLKRGCGGGLSFLIERTSEDHAAHRWIFEYAFGGRRKTLGLGTYPDIGLARARELAAEAKALVKAGTDPSAARKAAKQEAAVAHLTTFDRVSDAWLDGIRNPPANAEPVSADTISKYEYLIGRARPVLGALDIRTIRTPDVVRAIEPLVKAGILDTAHRVREILVHVFNFAAVKGLRDEDANPAIALLRQRAVLPAKQVTSHAAVTDPRAFGEMLRAIEGANGSYGRGAGGGKGKSRNGRRVTTLALNLICLTALRPHELRHLRWSWISGIDFTGADAGVQRLSEDPRIELPAEFLKMRKPHTVFLSRQAVEVLTELHGVNGYGELVFPAMHAKRVIKRTADGSEPQPVKRLAVRSISENTLNAALRRLGYGDVEEDKKKGDHVSHGFRTSFSSLTNESGQFDKDIVEVALNHADEDKIRAIYNRAKYEAERKRLSQWWADECDRLRENRPAERAAD